MFFWEHVELLSLDCHWTVIDFQFGLSERKMLTEIKIYLVAGKDNFKEIDA